MVKVLTFILHVCGCDGLVGTCHVTASAFVISPSVDHHPTMMEIARDNLATYVE